MMRACARRIGVLLVAEGNIAHVDDVFYLTVAELTAKPGQAIAITYVHNGTSTTVDVTPVPQN